MFTSNLRRRPINNSCHYCVDTVYLFQSCVIVAFNKLEYDISKNYNRTIMNYSYLIGIVPHEVIEVVKC